METMMLVAATRDQRSYVTDNYQDAIWFRDYWGGEFYPYVAGRFHIVTIHL